MIEQLSTPTHSTWVPKRRRRSEVWIRLVAMNTNWHRPGLRGTLLYSVLAILLGGVASLLCRMRLAGKREQGRLPGGPLIVVANHTSFADGILLALACRRMGRSARLLATAGVFDAPIIGSVMRRLGFIPVKRGTEQAKDALGAAAAALEAGEVVAMFPEGRITHAPGHWPERARTGAVRLALETGTPIVPIAINGAHRVVGRRRGFALVRSLGRSLVRLPAVNLLVGQPMDVQQLVNGDAARPSEAEVRRLSDLMMAQLINQVEELRGERAEHEYGAPRAA